MSGNRISRRTLLRSAGLAAIGVGGAWAFRSWVHASPSGISAVSHGTRLRLEWPQDGFVVSEGQEGSLTALIVNAGTQRWIDHNGEYYAIATLSDPSTGRELGER